MGFFNIMYEIGHVSANGAKMTMRSNRQINEAAMLANKRAYMENDMTYSCQKERCSVFEDYDSYMQKSKKHYNAIRIVSAVFWAIVLILCIIIYNRADSMIPAIILLLPVIEIYRFGASLSKPQIRVFQRSETILSKKHNFSGIKLFIPAAYVLIALISTVMGDGDSEIFGISFTGVVLISILLLLIGLLGYVKQSLWYTCKSYTVNLKPLFEQAKLLKSERLYNIFAINISNNDLFINNTSVRTNVTWYDLTDYGATALAMIYCSEFTEQNVDFEATVYKKYINGNDIKRNKLSKKRQKVQEGTITARHANVDTNKSGYVLDRIEITRKKYESHDKITRFESTEKENTRLQFAGENNENK